MCVLVRVEVREIDSGGLNLANLRRSFRGNFFSAYYARDCARRKALHAIAKLMNFGERGNFAGVEHGLAIKQDDMASDAKSRTLLCEGDRFCERRAIRHQCRGSYDAAGVGFNDGAVYAGCVSEIIRIDDEPPHAASLAPRFSTLAYTQSRVVLARKGG